MTRWVHMGIHSNEVFVREAQAGLTSKEPVVRRNWVLPPVQVRVGVSLSRIQASLFSKPEASLMIFALSLLPTYFWSRENKGSRARVAKAMRKHACDGLGVVAFPVPASNTIPPADGRSVTPMSITSTGVQSHQTDFSSLER